MTRSDRLILAGARSARVAPTRSTAAGSLCLLSRGGGGRFLGQPRLELLFDLGELFGLRLEVAGMRPLEARFEDAVDLPVCVAEMVVDGRVLGPELDGVLEVLHGLLEIADSVVGPAERVDDVAV